MDSLQVPGTGTTPPNTRPKLPPSRTTANRLPPPALFQGPPSRDVSNIDLSLHGAGQSQPHPSSAKAHAPSVQPQQAPRFSTVGVPEFNRPNQGQQREAKNENDRADALWAEMQHKLAEVELSASSGSHVFSAQHAKALEDLRTSQLALAQAWAKSEAEDVESHYPESPETNRGSALQASPGRRKGSRDSSRTQNLEEETESDIRLARQRREANDRYFQQVNTGVLDVVAKLEEVAGAMRQVEKESREIWSESDSSSASMTEATESPLTNR